jgi:hypothetical protein
MIFKTGKHEPKWNLCLVHIEYDGQHEVEISKFIGEIFCGLGNRYFIYGQRKKSNLFFKPTFSLHQ